MLLYHDPRAPNPRRVRMFLAEKGVAYDTIEVLIATDQHLSVDYRRKHPLSLLPVLELEDGRIIRESMAICRYIEETHPEPNLFGVDAWERAQIEQWNRHAELELLIPIQNIFRNSNAFWQGRIKQAPEFATIMSELVGARLDWLEKELSGRSYMAGDRFTVADITALCAIDFGKVAKVRLSPDKHPHLVAWHARCSARPSAKA
ncbi:MAG TPA: glutathione S-transferase family protein [Kofleriaceae bacterium]|nr:glutathione S-transferase family protein [Kofleriaceae bacterium]